MAIKYLIFDWGDTLMRDLSFEGPMKDWPVVYPIPDIEIALKELAKDFCLCVASNAGDSHSEDIGLALDRVDIRKYFKFIFSSKDIGYEKPNLLFFSEIRTLLNAKPEELVMIGNSCAKDIKGAKLDHWYTIWFNENQNNPEICSVADASFYHFSQFVELVHEITEKNDI